MRKKMPNGTKTYRSITDQAALLRMYVHDKEALEEIDQYLKGGGQ